MSRLIKAIYLKVGTHVYSGNVSDVNVPGLPLEIWPGSTPGNIKADVPSTGRVVNISGLQDWEDPEGLCQWLSDHEGETVAVTWCHNPGATEPAYFTVDAIAGAPSNGGASNAWDEFSLALPCTKPTRTVAPV